MCHTLIKHGYYSKHFQRRIVMKTSKMKWLWENMKGYHVIYIIAIFGAILYNVLQITIPYVTQHLIDLFLSGKHAAENLATRKDLF